MPSAEPMPNRRRPLRAPPAKPPRRQVPAPVEYPESDGKPMSETPIHWHATVDFAHPLIDRYAARPDAYVGSDMLMYWEEGDIDKRVSPDVFVAFGPDKEPERRVWKVWEEGVAADFVLEVTSRSTQGRDEGFKAELYERLGVTEYWQFDPTEDYLRPNLKGRRLGPDGAYEAVPLERRDGALVGWSEVLGLELRPEAMRCACSTRRWAISCPRPVRRLGSLGSRRKPSGNRPRPSGLWKRSAMWPLRSVTQ